MTVSASRTRKERTVCKKQSAPNSTMSTNEIKKFRRIGVLTSGGDAPGMNAAIRAVTRTAIDNGVEVMGILDGYQGLIDDNLRPLSSRDVSNIITRGGTILYSARCLEFKEEAGMQKAIATCKKHNIDGIVAIGGDGTFRGATDLSARGIATIGIPGTIDNDITASDYTIGFDTAMNCIIDFTDRLRDTCESHLRCSVVEVMGNHAGWLSLEAGIACGASAIMINELDFDEEACFASLIEQKNSGKHSFIVMISEGNGDWGMELAKKIQERTGIETKFARLAHVQRGGSPTLRDRLIASQMGSEAVKLMLQGKSDLVMCYKQGRVVPVEIRYSQILDRMYKHKLTQEQIDALDPKVRAEMEAYCADRLNDIKHLYQMANEIAK